MRALAALTTFLNWYFYWYAIYFVLIVILSVFLVKLGVSQCFVKLISAIFQLTENSRRNVYLDEDDEGYNTERRQSDINENRESQVLQNENSTIKTSASDHTSTSTIKRDAILGPGMCTDTNSTNKKNKNTTNDDDAEEDADADTESFSKCSKNVYHLVDVTQFVRAGIEAIVEDEITTTFEAEKLQTWNLLTRNNPNLRFYNWKMIFIWLIGFLLRYLVIFPIRFCNFITGISLLFVSMTVIGYIPESELRKKLYRRVMLMCFHVLGRWLGCVIKFHDTENRPKNGIAVANHTTPFDTLILNTDNCYAMTGQKHNGLIGFLENTLNRASRHIWFDRSVIADRQSVTRRLQEHVSIPDNPPILIFPEGTCINNTAVVQFKKGAFQVGETVHPIAIKYDCRFGNAFWDSSKQSALQHVLEIITSWSVVCDVWYLPMMKREQSETAEEFATRVKSEIAKKINLADLTWDGQLKRGKPKPEWKEQQRKLFAEQLKSRLRTR